MSFILQTWHVVLLALSAMIDDERDKAIEHLLMENQVLREKLGKGRILLNDDQRRRLAVKGTTPTRPNTRHRNPEYPVPTFNWRTFLAAFQNEQLLTKSQVLCREIGNNIELIACPIQGIEDDSIHH
jgi:hypothetical protein